MVSESSGRNESKRMDGLDMPNNQMPSPRVRQQANDKYADNFARPAKEDMHQVEGRTRVAFLGTVRSCVQAGNLARSLRNG